MRELEPVKNRVVDLYRRERRKQARLEKVFVDAPTTQAEVEMAEQRGFARGIRKVIDYFENHMNDHDFPEIP
jgi:hypothetical protein